MQRLATGLLMLMALVFIVARINEAAYPAFTWVRAFAEAAMVGALADWFAVVALFRHPLGLRIPHTAIIPRNKDRIGHTLAAFVVENFLSREVVSRRLESLDLVSAATGWLRANKRAVSEHAAHFIPTVLDALEDADVKRFLHAQLVATFKTIRLAPLAGDILGVLTTDNRHQELLNEALGLVRNVVDDNRDYFREKVREEVPLPDWVGSATIKNRIADYVANKLVIKVHTTLEGVAQDPTHPMRQQFETRLQNFIEDLKTSPAYHARGEELKEKLLQHVALQEYVSNVWSDVKNRIKADLADPNSETRKQLESAIERTGMALQDDRELRAKLNRWLNDALLEFLEQHRPEFHRVIEDTVRRWDAQEVSEKLELEVGRDLQFIRLNGTIVGGLVGLALHFFGVTLLS